MVDLFISYAHIDNQPLPPEEVGWISTFHQSLEAFISMRLGESVNIWRDDKLRGNDIFDEEIVDQFKDTKILVSILSPRYVQSEWCSKEVAEFCRAAADDSGLMVENKSRLMKIIKTPVKSEDALPEIVQRQLGYEFYQQEDGAAPLELSPLYGPEFAQAYNRKMGALAWDISQLLELLEEAEQSEAKAPEANGHAQTDGLTVFVAECGYDRDEDREKIITELKTHGHTVIPDRMLPKKEKEVIDELGPLLQSADLSIHLVGSSYGSVPDGPSRKSIVVLQNEISILHSKTGGLERLIWLPDGVEPSQPQQTEFIKALHRDPDLQTNADLIVGDLAHLKEAMHALIGKVKKRKSSPEPGPAPAGEQQDKLVYLICDPRDRRATVPIRKALKARGFDVEIPLFEGDAAQLRAVNKDLMASCDAVVLFYGEGDEAWKRIIDSDIRKMAGYREGRPLLFSCTYLAGPDSDHKEELVMFEEEDLLDGRKGFSEALLKPLLDALTKSGDGA